MENRASGETLENILRVATQKYGASRAVLEQATHFRTWGMDSLTIMDMVFELESLYDITLAATDLARVQSVRDLADLIDRQRGREGSEARGRS